MSNIIPITGWMLDTVVEHDFHCPGFAGHYLRASNERRQSIAAHLAVSTPQFHQREVAAFLMYASNREVLASFGADKVCGYRSALRKSGPYPHAQEFYLDLLDALSNGGDRTIRVVQHAEKLGPDRLEIISALPDDLLDPRIVGRLGDPQEAADLAAITNLLEQHGVQRDRFINALLCSTSKLQEVVQRWALRIPFPEPPIGANDNYYPVSTGAELRSIALRYRNCTRRYIYGSIVKDHAFGELYLEGGKVLLAFESDRERWFLSGVYAARNRSVPGNLDAQARDFVRQNGVLDRRPRFDGKPELQALRRWSRAAIDW